MFCWPIRWRVRAIAAALAVVATMAAAPDGAKAEDVSSPTILQWFEASYETMESRSADMFLAGYGAVWTPPPGRADSNQTGSVGYDVYDRFELGKPGYTTLYGTETGLKQFANVLHRFDGRLHIDAVLNHNGYSENDYSGSQYTAFRQAGGYPGFVLENPDGGTDPAGLPGTYGDFHNPSSGGVLNGQLSGLLDIDHGKNYQMIRQPVEEGNPQNIPAGVVPWAGRLANVPTASNARYYPDRDLTPATYYDPVLNQTFTVYPFNSADPMQGDAVAENATGLLMRNLQWLVQEVGVDGFRLDAAKHMEHYALQYMDAAVYRSNPRLLLDGSVENVFMYGEVVPGDGQDPGQDQWNFMQEYIRKDIDPNAPNTIGGNRDVLDFALRGKMNENLSSNGLMNDWRNVVNSSMDFYDDGLHNGSQGVAFVSNHDGGGAAMNNVAYAHVLTQPGDAIVYYNAHQYSAWPADGRGDAIGNYGDTITELVNIRNTHGRGDYQQRLLEKEYFAMERSGSMLVLLDNRNDAGVSSVKTMDTDFAEGTHLVELTGNAAAYNATSPAQTLPEVLTVNASNQVSARFLHNNGQDKGYLIYGLQVPQSADGLVITNASSVLEGGPLDSGNAVQTAKTRLADLYVVHADQISVRLDTQAVTLPDGFRDVNADGDNAMLRVNDGMDTNGNGQVDYRTPGSVTYGFEEFSAGNRSPGYGSPDGNGWYQESIDATNLPEGYNFIAVRAFRKGNGGTTVYNEFREVVYLDRLPPEAAVASFDPDASNPNNPNNRDLVVRSVDQTASNMAFLFDLPAGMTDEQVLLRARTGQYDAESYDRDQWIHGYSNVTTGNHVVTVVTFEPTDDGVHGFNVQRFAGLFTDTNLGAGFGDLDGNGSFTTSDVVGTGNNSAEDILYSQNNKFRAAFDVNGDGLGDNRDLFALGDQLVVAGAGQAVLDAYVGLLLKRGDLDNSGTTDVADLDALYANYGAATWLYDLNVDGVVDAADAEAFVTQLMRSVPGDFNLDGTVNAADYTVWRNHLGQANAGLVGDGDFDGHVTDVDYSIWKAAFGFERPTLSTGGASTVAVPEPVSAMIALLGVAVGGATLRRRRECWQLAGVRIGNR